MSAVEKTILSLLNTMSGRFRKRKPEDEAGPYYADLYVRSLAAAVDLIMLFTLFHRLFDYATQRFYASINHELLAEAHNAINNNWQQSAHLLLQSHMPQLWLLNTTLQVIVIGIAYVGCQWTMQTTPGRWVFGLRIVNAETLEPVKKWRYILRFLAYIPASLPFMLGIIWVSFNKRRRGWHDMIAGTVVVHTRPRGWSWMQIKRGYRWLREKLKKPTTPAD